MSKTLGNFFERKEPKGSKYTFQDPLLTTTTPLQHTRDYFDDPNTPHPTSSYNKFSHSAEGFSRNQQEPVNSSAHNQKEGSEEDRFEKLIASFSKLCANFESNHKKLLRSEESQKENYKQRYGYQ